MKNTMGKTRKVDNPYEIYKGYKINKEDIDEN
jgi:hypothetical protein